MPKLIFVLIVSLPSFVSADIIKCSFTEPFVSTTYSMVRQSLTVERADGPRQVIYGVSFQIKGPGEFELWSRHKEVLQKLSLDNNGSDGMSDNVYPYSVDYTYGEFGELHGGCTSNFLAKRQQP